MILDSLKKCPAIGILRGFDWDDLRWLLPLYVDAGFTLAEVTMNTPGAPGLIRRAYDLLGGQLTVGAGTVLNIQDLENAHGSGAAFIVTPSLSEEVAKGCRALELPFFPGALSPTEVESAWRWGATAVKVFPASLGGPDYIRALRGPFGTIRLLPTGGVAIPDISEYRRAGAFGLGLGSPLFPATIIRDRDEAALCQRFEAIHDALEGWHTS